TTFAPSDHVFFERVNRARTSAALALVAATDGWAMTATWARASVATAASARSTRPARRILIFMTNTGLCRKRKGSEEHAQGGGDGVVAERDGKLVRVE